MTVLLRKLKIYFLTKLYLLHKTMYLSAYFLVFNKYFDSKNCVSLILIALNLNNNLKLIVKSKVSFSYF